ELTHGQRHPMDAKKALAEELVDRYHGKGAGKKAREEFEKQFSKGEVPEEIPEVVVEWEAAQMPLAKVMHKAGVADSVGDGKRLIKQGGVEVDGLRQTDPEMRVGPGEYLLKVGKRRYVRIKARTGTILFEVQ
ncbi:MAG: S4 domain-containing protein, partial [Nitrospirota bacterium]